MKREVRILPLLLTLFFCMAQGQDLPMGGPARERVEQFKKIRMMEVLKLEEETSLRFFARYNKYQEGLREVVGRRDGFIDELATLRKSSATDAEYEKVFKELSAIESKIADERSKFLQDLKSVISTKQIAEYVIFERNFNRQLMQLMREMAQERRRMGSPMR